MVNEGLGHLDIWTSGAWDRHLGPAHLGHWGPLSWASPKVAEPMGVSTAQQQEPWKRASIPRWSMVIALGGRPFLDAPRFLPAAHTAGRYMSGNLGMDGQGASLWPARLGKLLQARRDLNLPTLGCRPTRQASRQVAMYIHTVPSGSLPFSLSALPLRPATFSLSARQRSSSSSRRCSNSCLPQSTRCFEKKIIKRTVASNSAGTRQPLIWPKVKSASLQKPKLRCGKDGLSAEHQRPCPCQSVARPRFTSAAAVAPVSGEPPHPPTRAAHLLTAFGTARA